MVSDFTCTERASVRTERGHDGEERRTVPEELSPDPSRTRPDRGPADVSSRVYSDLNLRVGRREKGRGVR